MSEEEEGSVFRRNEASLRGSIENSTLSEDEIRQLEEEQAIAEASARLRNEDYQLAYAIDILTGLNALGPNAR
jgi:carboxyl-terminal processing protease